MLSLDGCADQYVMALSPRESVVGLSTRADDADSNLRHRAKGLPLRRTTLEASLAARPQLVVRYWGGDPRLLRGLEARGAKVVTIEDASDFATVRANIRRVAQALDRQPAGEALIADMDARLARSAGAWGGKSVLYLTPGGFTTGPGTLVHAILRAAGLKPVATDPGYQLVSLEALALKPPQTVVLGFFDAFMVGNNYWGPGRHPVMQRAVKAKAVASLPGAWLGCPDWSAAYAVERLAASAPR